MKNFTTLMWLYLLFSIVGLLWPGYYIIEFVSRGENLTLGRFIGDGMANDLSSAITLDLFIGAGCFLIWIIIEGHRLKMRNLWFYFIFTFLIAFAFAGPLFLFFRERKLQEMKRR